ncbi:MAG: TolC family protein, partial [Candidatus Latescibacterota bacterium]
NEKGRDLGVLVQSDVLEARSAFLSRKQEVLEQKNQIRVAEDDIKLLLNLASQSSDEVQLVPTATFYIPEVDADTQTALETALLHRPDYLRATSEIEQYKIRTGVARNALLPELDFSASYRLNGSGGTFDRNLRKIGDGDAFGWNVGMNLSYPISNRAARTEFERQEIQMKRAQLNLDDMKEQIVIDIRSGIRKVDTNRERIEVAKQAVEANELKLRAEEEKFRNHLSTSYLVLQYQTDLANARSQYNRALMDCMLSVLELRQAKGTLLKDLHISILPLE